MKLFEYIDIMGPQVSLRINKIHRFKTFTGGILTMILCIISTLTFIGFGKDIIQKKLPQVNFNKLIASDNNESVFYLTDENFAFTFVNQRNGSYVEEVERKFNFYLNVYDNFDTGYTDTLFKFEKCEKERISKISDQLRAPSERYWCLKKNTTIEVRGVFLVGRFISTRLNVDFCENEKTNRTDCYPKEHIRSTLGNIQMHIVLDDYYTDSLNYEQPFSKTYYSDNILTTGTTFSRVMFYFKNLEYNTDDGWILETQRKEIRSTVESAVTTMIPDPNTNTIYSHMFVNSKWRDVYKRNYIKIQGVFAYIGGFISLSKNMLALICEFLTFPDILNIFTDKYFPKDKKSVNKQNDQSVDNALKSVTIMPFRKKQIICENSNPPEVQNHIKKFCKEEINNRTHIGYGENLQRYLCCKSKKLKGKISQIEFAEKKFIKIVSVENVVKISRNVSLTLDLLLESYQKDLLKYAEIRSEKSIGKEKTFTDLYNELETKINDPNTSVNKKLVNYFNNKK
jgi:hypothetical protein